MVRRNLRIGYTLHMVSLLWRFLGLALVVVVMDRVSSEKEVGSGDTTYCSNPDDESCRSDYYSEDIDMGVPQVEQDQETREIVRETVEYMEDVVYAEPQYESVRKKCKNEEALCSYWASIGECENNRSYMMVHCAPACQSCEMLDVAQRCQWDPTKPQAWQHGDLNRMFERITTDPEFIKYKPTILSQPSENEEEDGPWIITLDDFISDDECDALIQAGKEIGYERSMGGAAEKGENGEYLSTVTEHRTSYQTWCLHDCYETEAARNVSGRIEAVTGIGERNSEYLQLLRYQPGQYYKEHNDFIDVQVERPMGPRLVTVFLYLNEPEEGGGTSFPKLGPLTVQPKRGRALIWPSVLNGDFTSEDTRTNHEALPVLAGEKYSVNAWLHLGDFKDAYDRMCSYN